MIMRLVLILLFSVSILLDAFGQLNKFPAQTKNMTLSVFHFAHPNLYAIKTDEKDKISLLDEPFQREIKFICTSLLEFNPTIITVEWTPDHQQMTDSLYSLFKTNKFELKKKKMKFFNLALGWLSI